MRTLTVGFYGKYIPLQGVDVIVRAAQDSRCKALKFVLIGSGQTYKDVSALAAQIGTSNITFVPRMPYEELVRTMQEFDIALGIFGATDKTLRVIPNKIYDAIALGLPTITADTPAIREVFTDGVDILLARRADADDLAEKIALLASDDQMRKNLGLEARKTYERVATPLAIGRQFLVDLKQRSSSAVAKVLL